MTSDTEKTGTLKPTETVYDHPKSQSLAAVSWWDRYLSTLGEFTETARAVLDADCEYIVERGIFGSGEPSKESWPSSRSRRGLVIGSVQSGKTASMLGTIARSLDSGVDIIVVLAGTRLSLWQQTFERVQAQLDSGEDMAAKQSRRILLPKAPPNVQAPITSRYQMTPVRVERALSRRQPIIAVALKHTSHLQAIRQNFKDSVFPAVENLGRPVHMLVIDDEADDGSILDANVESSQDPVFGNLKQIPRAIADLWAPPSQTSPDNFYATYIGYTATPQANLLQADENPLSPRDFLVSLRTPLDRGEISTRSPTYTEPHGLSRYYTGGEVYYRRGKSAKLCVATTEDAVEDLADALRSFLVAGAIRIARQNDRLGPFSARQASFTSESDAKARLPKPHSMLIHPSALVEDQFAGAEDVLVWAGVENRAMARESLESGEAYLPETLTLSLDSDEAKWVEWLDRFRVSAEEIHLEFNTQEANFVPDWPTAKTLLKEQVIPGTRVAVVNSDPGADDRPAYSASITADGLWEAPRDISTIFVSGNVMARGLTLEGLTTSLFLRSSDSPLADTQMQMQRWFGYRGADIQLSRVFATEMQLGFFESYHNVDEALREVVSSAMGDDDSAPKPVALQGLGFIATGKIANLGNKPLHPGRKPFIKLMNEGLKEDPNAILLARTFTDSDSTDLTAGGQVRGRILTNPLTLAKAADLLDSLSYDSYRPGSENQLSELWSQVEARVAAVQPLQNEHGLYRPQGPEEGQAPSPVRNDCPYGIPAYLRLWEASLTRHVRGLFVTGERARPWPMVDLATKSEQQPKFWVGIRYGAIDGAAVGGPVGELPFAVHSTNRGFEDGIIQSAWGSNSPNAGADGFRGDEYFDYYHHGSELPAFDEGDERWRPPGSDGQILFYVNKRPGQEHPTIAVGVCIPSGGPDQFAAVVTPKPHSAGI